MPVGAQTVLKINIVLVGLHLLRNPDEVNAFANSADTEVVTSALGLTIGLPPVSPELGQRIELPRDRISIDLTPVRTTIEREYPSCPSDLEHLAKTAGLAIASTESLDTPPTAFGYNIEAVYNQTSGRSAFSYLGDKLFASGGPALTGWELVGGSGRFIFNSDEGRWSIRVEPRFNDEENSRVFLNMNLHKTESRLPDVDDMMASFVHIWRQAESFARHLDEGA